MADREAVVAYANQHGPSAAARRYGVPKGSVTSWQHRARQRQRQTPAGRWEQAARELLDRATAGRCLRCGGAGYLYDPHPARRYARRLVCPDCGNPRRRSVVTAARLEVSGKAAADRWQQVREREQGGDLGHPEAWQ